MNPLKKLKHLNGKEYPKSFPTDEETAALPKIKIKNALGKEVETPDFSKLERETVANVIMNCLARYKPENNKEGVFINIAMELFWDADAKEIKLKEKVKEFIIKVVQQQTLHDEVPDDKEPNKKVEVGTYWSWVTGQALAELGVKESD